MTNDGTQDPGPPPVLADPLSGLVTGGRYEAEPLKVRVVEPPMPDISAVREAMAGMLDEDSELDLGLVANVTSGAVAIPTQATPGPGAPATPAAPAPPATPAAPADSAAPATPAAPGTPTAPATPAGSAEPAESTDPTPTPPIGLPAQPATEAAAPPAPAPKQPVTAKVVTPGTIETPRRLPRQWRGLRRQPPPPRPASAMGRKSSAPSVAAIALLLLVIGVIAIVLIGSLIDTFTSIFG